MTLTVEPDVELAENSEKALQQSRKPSWFKRAGIAVGGIALAAGISIAGAPQAQATYWPMAGSYATKDACFDAGYEYQAENPAYTGMKCEKISDGSIKLYMWTND